MGLPSIHFAFNSLAVSAIQRSQRGVVALILRDETSDFESVEYKTITDVAEDDWTEQNLDYIQKTFLGVPSKVIVVRIGEEDSVNEALNKLANVRFDYLAAPEADSMETQTISTWIIAQRDNNLKTYKAVLANSASDHEGVINFATDSIRVGDKVYSAAEYTCRIAGILAGLSLERSATYFVLNEVESIAESEDPDADIDAGKLILINDGEKIKIGRGVNSLVTFTPKKSKEFSKIKIIEGMDLIKNDIIRTWEDSYVGKVNNSYDNQVLFLAAVNAYLTGLEGEVLNPNVDNYVAVDVEAQRQAWLSVGETEAADWDEQTVKNNAFGSNVFITGQLRFLDAMEDIQFNINV